MKKKKDFVDLENTRYGLFMSENSINLDIEYGREFLRADNPQTVLVYRLNLIETKTHSLYNQTRTTDKKFFPPIQISGTVWVEESKQEWHGGNVGGVTSDLTGNITVDVYLKELLEKNLDVTRGDIICYNLSGEKNRYYEVENANNITDTTNKTIGGFKPIWKKIIGTPVKLDTIPWIMNDNKGEFI